MKNQKNEEKQQIECKIKKEKKNGNKTIEEGEISIHRYI